MFYVSTFLAFRYIKSKRYKNLPSLSFFTSFIGIFLSVFSLIVVVSVMEGFKQEFEKTIIGIRPHLKIYLTTNGVIEDFKPNANYNFTSYIKSVKHISSGISGEVIASNLNGNRMSGVIISALNVEDFEARDILKKSIKYGDLKNFNEQQGLIIGQELAKILGVKIGDEINIISPMFRKTPFGSIPIHKTFKVSAIFDVGMHFYNASYIFMPLKQAQVFFEKEGKVSYFEVILNDPHTIEKAKKEIMEFFGRESIYISDWKTENKSFIEAINLQKSVMFFILFIFLLLSGFIMFSGLSAIVTQKNKTTAILRTIGLSKLQTIMIFLQVGLFTSLPAIIFGVLFGSIFVIKLEDIKNWLESTLNAKIFDGAHYFLSYIPSSLDYKTIVQLTVLSIIVCLFSVLIPSLKGIKSKPIESLKWE